MTTTTRPHGAQPREPRPRVLPVAAAGVALAVALASLVGALASGAPAALGALVGGGIALAFFVFGSAVVNAATRVAPHAAITVALTTYALQVVLVAAAFAVLAESGAVGTALAAAWVAGGVVVATVAWVVGQLVATSRARVPVYDIALPEPGAASSDPRSGVREAGAP